MGKCKLFKTIIHAIQEKKGEYIVSLDLRKIPEAVSDFFIICEVNNSTQLKAIAAISKIGSVIFFTAGLFFPPAIIQMVVYHAHCLHERIANS